jgi:hypothetical protein
VRSPSPASVLVMFHYVRAARIQTGTRRARRCRERSGKESNHGAPAPPPSSDEPARVRLPPVPNPPMPMTVTQSSPAHAKAALFRSLFRGREDVYPRRFESRKTGKSTPVVETLWRRKWHWWLRAVILRAPNGDRPRSTPRQAEGDRAAAGRGSECAGESGHAHRRRRSARRW